MSTSIISSRSNRRAARVRQTLRVFADRRAVELRLIELAAQSDVLLLHFAAQVDQIARRRRGRSFSSLFCCSSDRFRLCTISGRRHHLPGGRFCANAEVAKASDECCEQETLHNELPRFASSCCPAPTLPIRRHCGSPSALPTAMRREMSASAAGAGCAATGATLMIARRLMRPASRIRTRPRRRGRTTGSPAAATRSVRPRAARMRVVRVDAAHDLQPLPRPERRRFLGRADATPRAACAPAARSARRIRCNPRGASSPASIRPAACSTSPVNLLR